jgi:hypothetical protein
VTEWLRFIQIFRAKGDGDGIFGAGLVIAAGDYLDFGICGDVVVRRLIEWA